jgi:hypothetical protein
VKRTIIVMLAVVLCSAPTAATAKTNPADQRLADRLTLQFKDLSSGWKIIRPISRQFRRNTCAGAPDIQGAITGFVDSAWFSPISDESDTASSTTRVFRTVALAREWFAFAGGGKQAACVQAGEVAAYKKRGFAVSGLRHTRQSFSPVCWSHCSYVARSWQVGFTLSKQGGSWTYYYDVVAVRLGRAVVSFYFLADDYSMFSGETLVETVLARG